MSKKRIKKFLVEIEGHNRWINSTVLKKHFLNLPIIKEEERLSMPTKTLDNNLEIFSENEKMTNPYSGESVELVPEAVAVYDFIKGCEMLKAYPDDFDIARYWFAENFPKEYMILLD